MLLIIDDDIAVQASLMLLFQNENYEVVSAFSQEQVFG